MTTIGLIRHGVTEWNTSGRAQGHTDIPLSEEGREQARRVAERIASEDEKWDLVISSDLSRARQTAEAIAKKLGLPAPIQDARIREMHLGEIEGLTLDERVTQWGDNWREQELGIETTEAVAQRGADFIEEVLAEHKGKKILIVSHGGLIGLTLKHLLPEQFTQTLLENTSITILKHDETKWNCSLFNCSKHLV
ncbi:histidine phosphatase family protein [Jeotgalibacillus sp. ET6]|uniref:histidine phosphatase family protein n=1 Tax=Jeotgalibacillus sp. ET6 TaxID=3037260 RepID=UPI0024185D31|nr:histidine phosphatase family protein [Jeotgalibacillus sp. ET6]MDG5471232.1 histidine phosphatase family protein [Jeotgalibacillus sp. ET6]